MAAIRFTKRDDTARSAAQSYLHAELAAIAACTRDLTNATAEERTEDREVGGEAPPRAPPAGAIPSLRMKSRKASLDDGPLGPIPVSPVPRHVPTTTAISRLPSRRTTTDRGTRSDSPDSRRLLGTSPTTTVLLPASDACTELLEPVHPSGASEGSCGSPRRVRHVPSPLPAPHRGVRP